MSYRYWHFIGCTTVNVSLSRVSSANLVLTSIVTAAALFKLDICTSVFPEREERILADVSCISLQSNVDTEARLGQLWKILVLVNDMTRALTESYTIRSTKKCLPEMITQRLPKNPVE